jgi:uncharacterized protein YbjT (DUF2867 family)
VDAELILITGGTGTVGRVVSELLLDAGAQVRVLSRGLRATGRATHVVGDVRTGEGLAEAMRGVDTIVHCVDPAHHVVDAALAVGKPHLVFISIVGIDRVPLGYYRRKLADEQRIMDSGLSWTILRATQFHDLIAAALRVLAKPPILLVPAGWKVQPIDVREVGARLAELALAGPAGRVDDMGGPQVLSLADLARRYLAAVGKRRPVVSLPVPGRVSRGYRTGGNLTPEHAVGTISFERYLDEQLAAGTSPYSDAIRSYLRLPRRFWSRTAH